jgi:hypothetical protein
LQMRFTSAVNALLVVGKIRYVGASVLDQLNSHASHSLETLVAQDYLLYVGRHHQRVVQYINF